MNSFVLIGVTFGLFAGVLVIKAIQWLGARSTLLKVRQERIVLLKADLNETVIKRDSLRRRLDFLEKAIDDAGFVVEAERPHGPAGVRGLGPTIKRKQL